MTFADQNQPWMVALRSINEHALGWYRARRYKATYRCGGSVGFSPNFPFNIDDRSHEAPNAARTLGGCRINVNAIHQRGIMTGRFAKQETKK